MEIKHITYEEYQKDFCAIILTHGRANNVKTYSTLRNGGYTGPIHLILDDEDKSIDEYKERFGDQISIFNKDAVAPTFDKGDNLNDKRAVVYARNASFDIVRQLGYKYFIMLDDDYDTFIYKFDNELTFTTKKIKNLDKMFFSLLKFYLSTPTLSIAMAQSGDFIGGKDNDIARRKHLKRKAMNTFFCSVDRPFKFLGRINEDVNTYIMYGSRGGLFFTIPLVAVNQAQTQANTGGLTDIYLSLGTYVKSFYSVMYMPSSVKVREMGTSNRRLHHSINWKNTVPLIVER